VQGRLAEGHASSHFRHFSALANSAYFAVFLAAPSLWSTVHWPWHAGCTRTYTHIRKHVTRTRTHIHTPTCTCTQACTHAHMHTRAHKHTGTNNHTHSINSLSSCNMSGWQPHPSSSILRRTLTMRLLARRSWVQRSSLSLGR